MLTELYRKSHRFVKQNNLVYKRYFIKQNNFEHRLTILIGARGIGKTTTIAQYMQSNYAKNEALYVSLDDITNAKFTMFEIAEAFEVGGGKLLCFDEIHKYSNWSAELKSIYDTFPKLKVIASGSSALEIHKGSHDLSRRALVYTMVGMSFREFLELHYDYTLETYNLKEILQGHQRIADEIVDTLEVNKHRVIALFRDYLKFGYYPYYLSLANETMFFHTLRQNINVTIEADLLNIYPSLNGKSIKKIKLLLAIIMENVPYTPTISSLKSAIEVSDDRTLKEYLSKLDNAGLIKLLMKSSLSMKHIDKPEKIYLANTNLMYTAQPKIGNVRETFFMNQLSNYYMQKNDATTKGIYASSIGDFYVEERYIFEIGGKGKSFKQVKDRDDAFVVADDIEIGFGSKIPLWLFGFLY